MGGFAGALGDGGGDAFAPAGFEAAMDATLDSDSVSDAGEGGAGLESAPDPLDGAEVDGGDQGVAAVEDETVVEGDPAEIADQPVAEDAGEAAPEPAQAAAQGAPAVPEGVRVRSVDGKPSWVLTPEVGQQWHAKAQMADLAERTFGQPLTENLIQGQQAMAEGLQEMNLDLLSDNPANQAHVIEYFANVIRRAQDRGEIGHDALAGLISTAVNTVRQIEPASYRAIQRDLTRQVLDDVYEEALSLDNPQGEEAKVLWSAAQHLDNRLFGKYRPLTELSTAQPRPRFGPAARKEAPAPAPTADDQGRARAEFSAWHSETDGRLQESLSGQVNTVFASKDVKGMSLEDRYKDFPNMLASVKRQLSDQVRSALRSDQQLAQKVRMLNERAKMAVSPEVRKQIQAQVISEHERRIKQVISEKKGPILTEAAKVLSSKSSETQRRAAAAKQAGQQPSPSSGTATKAPIPAKGSAGKFFSSPEEFDAAVDQLLR